MQWKFHINYRTKKPKRMYNWFIKARKNPLYKKIYEQNDKHIK